MEWLAIASVIMNERDCPFELLNDIHGMDSDVLRTSSDLSIGLNKSNHGSAADLS